MYTMPSYLLYPAEIGGRRHFYDVISLAGAYAQGGFLPSWMDVILGYDLPHLRLDFFVIGLKQYFLFGCV